MLTLDRLPGTNASQGQLVELQAGYVSVSSDEPQWLYDQRVLLEESQFDAVRVVYNCTRPVYLRARVPPELLRPTSSRTLPQLQRWQMAREPTLPCSAALPPLTLRLVSSGDPTRDTDGAPLLPVQPVRESCVYRQDELCSVSLGYYNPNAAVVSAVSFNDMLGNRPDSSLGMLLARGQYQTNLFLPGRVYTAMTLQWQCAADAPGWMLGWRLMSGPTAQWSANDVCAGQ